MFTSAMSYNVALQLWNKLSGREEKQTHVRPLRLGCWSGLLFLLFNYNQFCRRVNIRQRVMCRCGPEAGPVAAVAPLVTLSVLLLRFLIQIKHNNTVSDWCTCYSRLHRLSPWGSTRATRRCTWSCQCPPRHCPSRYVRVYHHGHLKLTTYYVHIYIRTNIHTYIYTYIHT